MAKLPLIEIRPVKPIFAAEAERRRGDLYERRFVDAGTAADFMIGKNWCDWQLWIHGRKYEWPKEMGSMHYVQLAAHIMHGIDTDIAFYD